jgi:hypothetical protein
MHAMVQPALETEWASEAGVRRVCPSPQAIAMARATDDNDHKYMSKNDVNLTFLSHAAARISCLSQLEGSNQHSLQLDHKSDFPQHCRN